MREIFTRWDFDSPLSCPCTMRRNVVPTVFHTQNIYQHVWETVRTTLQRNVGLQLRGEGNEMEKNCGTNLSRSLPCFSNLHPGIKEQQNIKVWF